MALDKLPVVQPAPPLASSMRQLEENLSRADWLSEHINRLIGAFRRDDYADAAEFVKQATIVLAGYDDAVIEYVCSPQTGLQRTQKFAPVLAEIVEACDKRVKAIAQQKELDAWRERKRRSDEIKKLGGARYSAQEKSGMTYKEFCDYCAENNVAPRPLNRFESMEYLYGTTKPETE